MTHPFHLNRKLNWNFSNFLRCHDPGDPRIVPTYWHTYVSRMHKLLFNRKARVQNWIPKFFNPRISSERVDLMWTTDVCVKHPVYGRLYTVLVVGIPYTPCTYYHCSICSHKMNLLVDDDELFCGLWSLWWQRTQKQLRNFQNRITGSQISTVWQSVSESGRCADKKYEQKKNINLTCLMG